MKLTNNQKAFFSLLSAGLWEGINDNHNVNDNPNQCGFEGVDWSSLDYQEVMRLAEEQSVVGSVTAGMERVPGSIIPKVELLQFIGQTLQIEQVNKEMNAFIADLVSKMRSSDIYLILVKGQGVAQCYEKPDWRSSGDVDFLVHGDNYQLAQEYLRSIASSEEPELNGEKHVAFNIGSWVIEVHGSMPTMITPRIDRMIANVQNSIFYGGEVRTWNNGGTSIFLPAPDNDVILVFTHFIKHFLRTEGVGLRQICDWCRLLWKYRNELDLKKLESRLRKAGLMSEWRAFAALAVDWLGMPVEAMPLYSDSSCWKRKANRILACILDTGNFGHNRDNSFYQSQSLIKRKAMSFWRQTKDSFRHLFIFPGHTIFIWFRIIVMGFRAVFFRK